MTVEVTNPLHALPAEMWQAGHVDFYQKFVRQGPFFLLMIVLSDIGPPDSPDSLSCWTFIK